MEPALVRLGEAVDNNVFWRLIGRIAISIFLIDRRQLCPNSQKAAAGTLKSYMMHFE
jgi:hypothetical protein